MTKRFIGCENMNPARIQRIGVLMLLLLAVSGYGDDLGTRQKTILPLNLPPDAPGLAPSNVAAYTSSGFGAWQWGPGADEGAKFDLMPPGYAGAPHAARLLSFFSISDIHITDKESPAQVPYAGWSAAYLEGGPGGLNQSAYSPVMLDTTFHLDAAVKTINALHRATPFDFGLSLGDVCNSAQYNELRWFIDVMDGLPIRPSSGDHLGETDIDYQISYQAAGLDRSIPWYAVIGNHDQFWMGIGYPTEKIKAAMVGSNVLNVSAAGPLAPNASEGAGMYVGIINNSTPFNNIIN